MNLYPELIYLPDIKMIFEIGCDDLTVTAPDLRSAYPDAVYFAFDPDPRNIEKIRISGADKTLNIQFFPVAFSDKRSISDFYLSTSGKDGIDDWAYSSSLNKPTEYHVQGNQIWFKEQPIPVQCETLDDFCLEHNVESIDLLHIDVQAAEKSVLLGASRMITRTRFIFMEVNTGGVYCDESSLEDRMKLLPGWELIKHYPYDVLLENRNI